MLKIIILLLDNCDDGLDSDLELNRDYLVKLFKISEANTFMNEAAGFGESE